MEIAYTKKAKEDIAFWKNSGKQKIMSKISNLINSIEQTPYAGIGKPEPLKHSLTGCWSRRINQEHRIVHELKDDRVIVHSLKGHY
jgi:toxin YoeB